MHELFADERQYMKGVAIFLVSMFSAKRKVNALSIVQTQVSIWSL